MKAWSHGTRTVEMQDESEYSFGSTDNVRQYSHELLLGKVYRPTSIHGLVCIEAGERRGSVVLGVGGGATGVHGHSVALLETRCYVAVGDEIVCLAVPELSLLWHVQADQVTCFGVYLDASASFLIVHGEMEISKLSLDGEKIWGYGGRDIFTGDLTLTSGSVLVTDFDGQQYSIDLENGWGKMVAGAAPTGWR